MAFLLASLYSHKTSPSSHLIILEVKQLHNIKEKSNKVPKNVMKPDFSPMKKKEKIWGNVLDVYATLVLVLYIAIPTHSDKDKAPWMKPIVNTFEEEEDEGKISEKLKTMAIMNLKGVDKKCKSPKHLDLHLSGRFLCFSRKEKKTTLLL